MCTEMCRKILERGSSPAVRLDSDVKQSRGRSPCRHGMCLCDELSLEFAMRVCEEQVTAF